MAEPRSKHLDQQLDKSYFVTSTIKHRTPYTLRVEKTQAMLASDFQAWIERAQPALTKLNTLSRKGLLREILGANYDSIFAHPNLRIPDPRPTVPAPSGLNWNVRNPVQSTIPSKRPFRR
jgi:hypothetical protein